MEVISKRIALIARDLNVRKPRSLKQQAQTRAGMQYEVLTPERKCFERFAVIKGEQRVPRVGQLDQQGTAGLQARTQCTQFAERICKMLKDVKHCNYVERIGLELVDTGNNPMPVSGDDFGTIPVRLQAGGRRCIDR